MRQLKHRGPPAGLTLIELMVGLAIGAILFGMAGPYFKDYLANSRLREAGNALLAETLYAQTEAIKRNAGIRLSVAGGAIQVLDLSAGGDGTPLRSRQLPEGVVASANASVDFGSRGMPMPFGTDLAIDLVKSGLTCSADLRCPGLRIDGGGGVRLCGDQLSC